MEVCSGHAQIMDLVQVVDRTMTEFRLDTFYKVSNQQIGFCPGASVGKLVCVSEQVLFLQ